MSAAPPSFPREYNAAVDLLDRHLEAGRADKLAYVDAFGRVSYGALAERVNRAGDLLRGLGVQVEERVMLVMLDTVDFVATFLGAIKIGAVPVPVNTLLPAGDYAHLLHDSRARALVVSESLLPKVRAAAAASPWLAAIVVADAPEGGEDDGHLRLTAGLAAAAPELAPAATQADDVAFWLYSSGSTGRPKAAMHLHSHLGSTATLYAGGVLDLREDDVILSAAKLFFAYGLGNALTFPLWFGASAILHPGRPTPAAIFELLREHRCSVFGGVPTLFASMLADPAHAELALPALRLSTSAGEALPRHVGERWRARFGSDIFDGIGSTEMLHIFLSNRPGDVRYGTSGRPVGGYELRLVGDDGAEVYGEQEGALWVRGPSAAIGYFHERARSLETFHGPWTRTGDRYARDADGYYTYCGRGDDMLKVGGIWVSPFEVESALAAHEAVLEAAVVGHADADGLVKPKAFVVARDPAARGEALAAALKAFVKDRLAPYKYPRWIEFVDELPKTATGKIQRYRLRG
ncbi:MAG: benzoate-CoA ligase family protein [Nannocystaceae bacterium]